jgi:hypothetical protein
LKDAANLLCGLERHKSAPYVRSTTYNHVAFEKDALCDGGYNDEGELDWVGHVLGREWHWSDVPPWRVFYDKFQWVVCDVSVPVQVP